MQKRQKAKAITLIEILLVLSLIAMALGATQFGFTHFIKEEAFVQECAKIKKAIAFAEELMMDTGSDLTLTLQHDKEEMKLLLSTSKTLPKRLLLPLEQCCKEITFLYFNDKPTKKLVLHFEGHLGITSKGVITLENKKGKKQYFVLRGFPGGL